MSETKTFSFSTANPLVLSAVIDAHFKGAEVKPGIFYSMLAAMRMDERATASKLALAAMVHGDYANDREVTFKAAGGKLTLLDQITPADSVQITIDESARIEFVLTGENINPTPLGRAIAGAHTSITYRLDGKTGSINVNAGDTGLR